jgi:hypothetical protein
MYEHNEEVTLAGVTHPIRCNINVLIEIQDRYDTLENFEMKLTGIDIVKDRDGRVVRDDKGNAKFTRREPSLRAVRDILPFMLSEGGCDDYNTAVEAVRNMEFDRYQVAASMHKEYSKCFERKNQQSAKAETRETRAE